ncbi:unnamed protein product [Miscanthus lutarioriparius]|uniref:Serpin domain-containing protein n=1 Tax=Miscanthus lutarioriparius TaxID=422564 RepID=A0A811SP99_9POAL|nr:unnamed protein product [Miscanthus lutarioriparius]
MAGPWFAFAPPHPWAPQHAPVFAQAPVDPFPWSMPVSFANPFDGPRPSTQNVPWGPPGEVPFASFAAGPAAPEPEWRHGLPDVFAGSGRRSVPAVVPPDLDADGGASCLPLARQAGLRAAGERNFIVSPLSFHAALALVAAGARGETQRELLGFLGSDSLDELQRAAATALVARLRDLPQTSFACGVWVDRGRALTSEFRDAATSRYAAVAESVDFASEPEAARRRVNAFVSEATKGLIDDVLPPGSVDSNFTAPFHLPDGATVRAPFMTTSLFKEQQVAVFPGFKALKLPYKNDGGARHAAFYMLLLLPDGEALKISDLYDKAVSTPGFIRRHTPVDEVPVGRFMVPKFKFTFEFEASGDIQKLGSQPSLRRGRLLRHGVRWKRALHLRSVPQGHRRGGRGRHRGRRGHGRVHTTVCKDGSTAGRFRSGPALLVRHRGGEEWRPAVPWACGEPSGWMMMLKPEGRENSLVLHDFVQEQQNKRDCIFVCAM